jgi:hypothetical protein
VLPTVRASGRPKSDAVAGIANGGNFRGHRGRKANRKQASQAMAEALLVRFVRENQPVVAPTQQAPKQGPK